MNFKYILTGLVTASALAMVSPAMADEDANTSQTETENYELVEYDSTNLDDLIKSMDTEVFHEETKLVQTPYKGENTLEVKEEEKILVILIVLKSPVQIEMQQETMRNLEDYLGEITDKAI